MATPVELKTLITVKLDEALVIPIEWKQDGQKKADYYSGTFTFGEQSGVIFVQKSKLEEFKGHLKDNQIEVNDKFQYGQEDSKGLGRWLVYHDKTNKPYQHRFAQNLGKALKYGDRAVSMLISMGITPKMDHDEFMEMIKSKFGSDLHDFKATN